MKHELSVCILFPTLAGYLCSAAKVGIKMHALSLYLIPAAWLSTFYYSPYKILKFHFFFTWLCTFSSLAMCAEKKHVQL